MAEDDPLFPEVNAFVNSVASNMDKLLEQENRILDMVRRRNAPVPVREQEVFNLNYSNYREAYPPRYGLDPDPYFRQVVRRPETPIICPVCGSGRCCWWEQQIMRNNAGEILKDMLQGVFKGEQYYDRGGGYNEQEEYYQRMRERFYRPQPPKPEPVVSTEDTAYDVVSTEIKGKPKKQIPYPIFSENK